MADDPPGDKLRFRFAKTGDLRLISHHDLMRFTERLLRRAEIPFRSTAGFHPSPRIVFALSLPLGVIGLNEVMEVELTTPLLPAAGRDRLNRFSPAGLTFQAAKTIPTSASAVARRAMYRMPLPSARRESVQIAAESLLTATTIWVDKTHPRPRRVNIRPYIRGISVTDNEVSLDLWVTGQGTARAEELVKHLGLVDLLAGGTVLERTDLKLRDEAAPDQGDAPPDGPAETASLDPAPATVARGEQDTTTRATWGLSPNGPVVE